MIFGKLSCSLITLFLCLVSYQSLSIAQTTATLHGLRNISVSVSILVHPSIRSEFENSGLTELTLRNAAEIRLRKAGVNLIEGGQAELQVTMYVSSDKSVSFYIYNLVVDLKEKGYLYRNPNKEIWGRTWGMYRLGIATNKDIRRQSIEFVEDSVNDFINQYLAANPKK